LRKLVLLIALLFPLSVSAEFRSESKTDMHQLAADLSRALGADHVEVEGSRTVAAPRQDVSDADLQPYVDAMNRERASLGEKPLRLNRALCAAAGDRIRDMFAQHYFSHDAPDGTRPFDWVTREGYDYTAAGENLAVGYRSAEDVVDGWMHSPGHRANILNKSFEEIGLAVAQGTPVSGFRGPLVVAMYGCR